MWHFICWNRNYTFLQYDCQRSDEIKIFISFHQYLVMSLEINDFQVSDFCQQNN